MISFAAMGLHTAFFTDEAAQPNADNVARLAINTATFLTILCWIFITLFIISRFTPILRQRFADVVGDKVFFLVWLVPTTAMFFSLFFSEYLGWRPCRLCWYQRVFMYTLAVLMLVYWFWRKREIRIIGYVLAALGPLVSIYHVAIEIDPNIESLSCDPNNPCASPWFKSMGFLTTAGMALTAFITILVLLYLTSQVAADTEVRPRN